MSITLEKIVNTIIKNLQQPNMYMESLDIRYINYLRLELPSVDIICHPVYTGWPISNSVTSIVLNILSILK